MPFYRPYKITKPQIKHLLAIYHGEVNTDLDSNIVVHSSRSKLSNPIQENDTQEFIAELEMLQNETNIEEKVVEILTTYEQNITKGSAAHLLYKRLATLSCYKSKTLIAFTGLQNTVFPILFSNLLSWGGTPIVGSAIGGMLVSNWINSLKRKPKALSAVEEEQLQVIRLKLQEFCTIKSTRIPKIIPVRACNASYNHNNGEPFINFGLELFTTLDTEEQYAVLAHELGHATSHENSNEVRNLFAGMLILGLALESLDVPYTQVTRLILLVILVIINNTYHKHPEEHKADKNARELAGPLAQASSQYTLHQRHLQQKNPFGFFSINNKTLAGILETTGLDDIFSTHPGFKKRI